MVPPLPEVAEKLSPSWAHCWWVSPWWYEVLKEHLIHEITGKGGGSPRDICLPTTSVLWDSLWHLYLRQTAKYYWCGCNEVLWVSFLIFFLLIDLTNKGNNQRDINHQKRKKKIQKLLNRCVKNGKNMRWWVEKKPSTASSWAWTFWR